MGFFKSLMGDGGGSQSATGDPLFMKLNKNIAQGLLDFVPNKYKTDEQNQAIYDMFTPMAETADETRGFDMIRGGFAPTEESMRNDIGMFMNPFDDFVINDINRQAAGDYSIMKQYGNETGQMGSNRNMLAASDVEQNRLNNVGMFRQNQYNSAIDRVLDRVIPQREQDAFNLTGIGAFQRGLDLARKQAPITALNSLAGTSSMIPTNTYNVQRTKGASGGLLGSMGSIAGLASGISGLGAGAGLWGGFDPSSGITWNSGRV